MDINSYERLVIRTEDHIAWFEPFLTKVIKEKYNKPFLIELRIKSVESIERKRKYFWEKLDHLPVCAFLLIF